MGYRTIPVRVLIVGAGQVCPAGMQVPPPLLRRGLGVVERAWSSRADASTTWVFAHVNIQPGQN